MKCFFYIWVFLLIVKFNSQLYFDSRNLNASADGSLGNPYQNLEFLMKINESKLECFLFSSMEIISTMEFFQKTIIIRLILYFLNKSRKKSGNGTIVLNSSTYNGDFNFNNCSIFLKSLFLTYFEGYFINAWNNSNISLIVIFIIRT